MKIALIDNYDSFTYNLYQLVGKILIKNYHQYEFKVFRNNDLSYQQFEEENFDKVILSPGPGNPEDPNYFGICGEILTKTSNLPILGICLGMQGICHYFGGKVISAPRKLHGKSSVIKHDEDGLFKNLDQNIEVMRYHSLIADPSTLPKTLQITAVVQNNFINDLTLKEINQKKSEILDLEIMGLKHILKPISGVQFHPESFATEGGETLIENFLLEM